MKPHPNYTFQQISAMAKTESKKLGRVVKPSEVCRKIWNDYQNEILYRKVVQNEKR